MDDEVKAVWTTAYVNDLPNSAFLYVEEGDDDGEGKRVPRSKRHFPVKDASGKVDLPHLRNAIARIPQSNAPGLTPEKKRSLQDKARRMLVDANKAKESSLIGRIVMAVKSALHADEPYEEPVSTPGLTLWKEDGGPMRWLGVFSNNYRDDDTPAEILSADAHREFAAAVTKGEAAPPELWFWHVPFSRFGVADTVMYEEDTGFQLAMGVIDEGKEHIAAYCQQKGYVMSHGMPRDEVQRSEDDPTVIIRYRSREVSALPAERAANKITSFSVKGAEGMNIPQEKIDELVAAGFDVNTITEQLEAAKRRAEDEMRESKEVETEAKDAEGAVTEAEEVQEVTDAQPEVTEPAPQFTAADFATAAGTAINDALSPVVAALSALSGRLEAMEGAIKSLEHKQKEQAAELELTPAASLAQMIKSAVIGADETRVDGRSSEAKDTPKETPALATGQTGVPFIDTMLAGKDWRDGMRS